MFISYDDNDYTTGTSIRILGILSNNFISDNSVITLLADKIPCSVSLCDVMANVLDNNIVVSEIKLTTLVNCFAM